MTQKQGTDTMENEAKGRKSDFKSEMKQGDVSKMQKKKPDAIRSEEKDESNVPKRHEGKEVRKK